MTREPSLYRPYVVTEGACYVNDMSVPALVVPKMFHGADARGAVGLYVDNGTEGNFRNSVVSCAD